MTTARHFRSTFSPEVRSRVFGRAPSVLNPSESVRLATCLPASSLVRRWPSEPDCGAEIPIPSGLATAFLSSSESALPSLHHSILGSPFGMCTYTTCGGGGGDIVNQWLQRRSPPGRLCGTTCGGGARTLELCPRKQQSEQGGPFPGRQALRGERLKERYCEDKNEHQ
jgi:hypothetical protein